MPIGQYGSQRKPDQSRYQQFDVATWMEFIGIAPLPNAEVLSLIASAAIGIFPGAIDLDAFCSTEPTGPSATDADWIELFTVTPIAVASGALDRVRNDYMRWQFSQWCLLSPPPAPTTQYLAINLGRWNGGPAGSSVVQAAVHWTDAGGLPQVTDYGEFSVAKEESPWPITGWTSPPINGNVTHLTVNVVSTTLGQYDTQFVLIDCPPIVGTNMECSGPLQQSWGIVAPGAGLGGYDGDVEPPGGLGSGYPAPEPPTVPPNADAIAACPPVTSFEAVGSELCELNTKLDSLAQMVRWIASNVTPPTYNTDPVQTPVASGGALDKPVDAIGAVIELVVPSSYARYGQNPEFFPDIGHYALLTRSGPLPGAIIKHSTQVVWPIPPTVTQIVLDLSPGVTGFVQWLHQPK